MITTASLKFHDELLARYAIFQTPVLRTATSLPVLGMIFITNIQSSGWNQNFFSDATNITTYTAQIDLCSS
jgi:hypothetical protein